MALGRESDLNVSFRRIQRPLAGRTQSRERVESGHCPAAFLLRKTGICFLPPPTARPDRETQMLRRTCAFVSIAFALSLFAATVAATTAKRTFVASTGNDANLCSIAAPCRNFARAIMQTSTGGEVIVLDSAGYGAVTITQSVSIIAPAGIYAGISVFSGDGVTVNAPGATVVLRGLSINGQGGSSGVNVQQAARLRIESCVISGMASDGIHHTAVGAEMIVLDTIVRDNGGAGINVVADLPSISLNHVRSEHNTHEGFHVAPMAGTLGAIATITDSVFTYNAFDGIGADAVAGATITLVVDRSVMSSNGQNGFRAAVSAGAGVATLSRSTINDNGGNGISMQDGIQGAASDNVVHRNSGYGILVSNTLSIVYSTLSRNFLLGNLSGAIHASGSDARVAVSANTTSFANIECDGAALYTFGDNATNSFQNFGGCSIQNLGLK
jgi:hypothetical protein